MKLVDLVWWPLSALGFGVFLRFVLADERIRTVHIRRWTLLLKEVMDHHTNRVHMLNILMCLSILTEQCGSISYVINTVATETEQFTRLVRKPAIVLYIFEPSAGPFTSSLFVFSDGLF